MKTTSYHHGALREALLAAAETILKRDGSGALTLRAAAREAGVSHAAPSHHFGDLTGLLSELAAEGFQRLGARLRAAADAPATQRWDGARTYVAFAMDNGALFQLMFRSDRLDNSRPALKAARADTLSLLAKSRGAFTDQLSHEALSMEQLGSILGGWSLVHGYTLLLLDGRLKSLMTMAPVNTTADELFEAMLASTDRLDIGPKRA